ncbi:TPA: AN1-type zinc finger domain-containing protein [archaeon]|nr:AN1-type zinc finger domain-containing protein [Candidatus Naiadarchaeales archaeon SRR2090159.bin1288]
MSILTTAVLAGIGIGAGAILFYHYLMGTPSRENRVAVAAEMPVSISFSTNAEETMLDRIKPPGKPEKKVGGAPLKAACGVCKESSMLPFKCKFCSSLYCGEHRLPESHDCEAL